VSNLALYPQSRILDKWSALRYSRNAISFLKAEGTAVRHWSLLCARRIQFSLSHLIYLISILILYSHVPSCLPVSLLPSGLPTRTLCHTCRPFVLTYDNRPKNSLGMLRNCILCNYPSFPPYLFPLRSKYILQRFLLEEVLLCSFLRVWKSSHLCKIRVSVDSHVQNRAVIVTAAKTTKRSLLFCWPCIVIHV
jgi:hypothetical protein